VGAGLGPKLGRTVSEVNELTGSAAAQLHVILRLGHAEGECSRLGRFALGDRRGAGGTDAR
jgi:hypothetical protein